jgi:ubiquinone/menaquinone biosynthesis C-methylase UbiE
MPQSDPEDVQRFHRWSATYERHLAQAFLFDPVHRAVVDIAARRYGGAPGVVLDIGCGTGRLLRRAARRWPAATLTGVDPADGMIEQARALHPAATFHVGAGEALPLPDATTDVAFSTISFHHWADQAAGVREVARVLRDGGIFCLADGFLPSLLGRFVAHTRIHTAREMRGLFEQAGLTVIAQKRMAWGGALATLGRKG